ncbi:MAG TPA: preprotein translocase subunit SecY, partial [Phycisphaerales bacterium]|nr:preprotein translocase subunit SecY [Phycisphaerales bacterium]
MLQALVNVFRIAELRTKILFTLGMLAVFRIGHWVPLPGLDQTLLAKQFDTFDTEGSAAGRMATFVSVFSGGAFGRSTIFGLGVMPYISASIIFQLLASVLPSLKTLQNEGPTGRQKIMEWTRLTTIGLCIVQGIGWLSYINKLGMVQSTYGMNPVWWIMAVAALTAGCMFLMWLGEQIDKHGIGNGVSLIITAGILTQMPGAIEYMYNNFNPRDPQRIGWSSVFFILAGFVVVVAGPGLPPRAPVRGAPP